tara:strand:+ start:988 stop:1383 length:396 start_codon:yes stop_codon:yes gene_type:complete
MKNLVKLILFSSLSIINIGEVISSEQNCVEGNNENHDNYQIYTHNSNCNKKSLEMQFFNSFSDYRSYEEVIKPENQFVDFLGLGGFPEQRLKRSGFKLWETYKKESSKQIGKYRLNGSDIDNTYNQTLKEL